MKIDIKHVEKSQGLVFKKKFHGVQLSVSFSEEETKIITERRLQNVILMERSAPADVDGEAKANQHIALKIATAIVKGKDALHYHLTIGKLMRGPDVYFMDTPLEAKRYDQELRELLPDLKEHIMGNADIAEAKTSFEL